LDLDDAERPWSAARMVVRAPAAWVRAAAVAILLSWLPCVPVGLCMTAPAEAAAHSCCPRSGAPGMSAAPRECWLESPAPLPVVAPTSGPGTQAAVDVQSPVVIQAAPVHAPRPAAFSALAVVLRI
jgi:hypothetical protein